MRKLAITAQLCTEFFGDRKPASLSHEDRRECEHSRVDSHVNLSDSVFSNSEDSCSAVQGGGEFWSSQFSAPSSKWVGCFVFVHWY